ncbi:MAG: TetR/AcrR family transcriptional regulator [Chthonomonadales bacterium]|nr:TetR/AcrR family transcriptional regulator [Chthonomonadales bacterium]
MERRDSAEFEEKRRRILAGALRVFAEKGYQRATNREIARAAGIGSPGLIYHYFESKGDLFRQVFLDRLPFLKIVGEGRVGLDGPPEEVLPAVARAVAAGMLEDEEARTFWKLVLAEAMRNPEAAAIVNEVGPGRMMDVMTGYMARQMERGALRRMDPAAAVRCFAGGLVLYFVQREVLGQEAALRATPEEMVAAVVSVFLDGMRPPAPEGE